MPTFAWCPLGLDIIILDLPRVPVVLKPGAEIRHALPLFPGVAWIGDGSAPQPRDRRQRVAPTSPALTAVSASPSSATTRLWSPYSMSPPPPRVSLTDALAPAPPTPPAGKRPAVAEASQAPPSRRRMTAKSHGAEHLTLDVDAGATEVQPDASAAAFPVEVDYNKN